MSGSQIFRNIQEFRQAMRHRYVLANCAGLTFPGIMLLYALDNTQVAIDFQLPSVVVALVAAQVFVIIYLSVAVRLVRARRRNSSVIRVWVTPGLMLGAAGMLGVAQLMHLILEGGRDWTEVRSHLIPFLCMIYLELAMTVIFRGPIPRVLAKMRGTRDPLVPEAVEVAPSATVHAPNGTSAPVRAERAALGNRLGFPAAEVLRLEASGNYVTVVTRKGRHLLPGPFAAVMAQMPDGLGRQVHRSHWVQLAAVEGVKRKGREMLLQVACGALVPVSSALRAEVQAWLEDASSAVAAPNTMPLRSGTRAHTRHGSWSRSEPTGGQA